MNDNTHTAEVRTELDTYGRDYHGIHKLERAIPHAHIGRENWYRIPVKILYNSYNSSELCATEYLTVIARNTVEALDWVERHHEGFHPEAEIRAYGRTGGEAYRFVGWERSVGLHMPDQGDLDFGN